MSHVSLPGTLGCTTLSKCLCQQSLPAPWAAAPGADKCESSSMAWLGHGTWGTGEALEEPHCIAPFSTALGSIPSDKPQSPASAAVRSAGHQASSSPCRETQPVLTRDLLLISSYLAQVSLSLSVSFLCTSRSLSMMPWPWNYWQGCCCTLAGLQGLLRACCLWGRVQWGQFLPSTQEWWLLGYQGW